MKNDFLDRYDLMQRLGNRKPVTEDFGTWMDNQNKQINMMLVCVWVVISIILGVGYKKIIKPMFTQTSVVKAETFTPCNRCHNRVIEMTKYFKKAGSKHPEVMAHAVLQTKRPKLLAAVAVVETGGNHKIRATGFRHAHSGAFQVNPRDWGKVPKDAIGQALQAEAILEELTETKPLKKALAHYGGDSTDKYSRRVLAELVRVP
jgi:hypothetical protein